METIANPRMIELIAERAETSVAELELDRTLEEIGLDSLHLLEITLWVQREYDIVIAEGEIHDDQTVNEVLAYVAAKTG